MKHNLPEAPDFSDFTGIRLSLASPETILSWSKGEVTRADTINYRTQRPEKDGLFCEKIFGPVKDYECACGKYKKAKYRGTVCERCGVEVLPSSVRRERMGHIDLAVPVAHIFFYKIPPSKIGLLLDLTINQLEQILNYEAYIVVNPGSSNLPKGAFLTEEQYQELKEKNIPGFYADTGGQPIYDLLKEIDLEELASDLRTKLAKETLEPRRIKLISKLKLVEALRLSGNRPEWMMLTRIPVIPPDLRPLVALEGGRYATSDLNDLYKRVITRNNRVKQLISGIKTPEVIVRNEKRMLQDAVDALLDNSRRMKPIKGRGNRPLKSLADALKGKQGRFRRNLLGKRVDYSGRSVIVVDPNLKLYQCGIPKEMALELFKPMIIRKLEERGVVDSERSARRLVRSRSAEVYEILEEVIKEHPVLLNRAPTLHRVSIQAFIPVLKEGRAIAIHPLVCVPYNADFDGDTMSVHVPLSPEAIMESYLLMLSIHNIRSPANGRALMTPTQDIVIGLHYLTKMKTSSLPKKVYDDVDEIIHALEAGYLSLHEPIIYIYRNKRVETTPGRVIFNQCLPEEMRFKNDTLDKKKIASIVDECLNKFGTAKTVDLLDKIKKLGFEYATRSGLTIGIDDMKSPKNKEKILKEGEDEVNEINRAHRAGLISETERYNKVIDTWTKVTSDIEEELFKELEQDRNGFNPLYMMVASGARGSRNQANQICGLRGLMSKPQRKVSAVQIIETPIKSSCKEGLTVVEYFISTHGARKGLADTALKTANAGYLTRRLVDVAQDVILLEEDCGTKDGIYITALIEGGEIIMPLEERLYGRTLAEDIKDPLTGEIIVKRDTLIDQPTAKKIVDAGIDKVKIRSVLTCRTKFGLCAKCYGMDLARGEPVEIGEAVGVISAQSIGEPGTQLTMRTFHIGGAATKIVEQAVLEAKNSGTVKFKNVHYVERKDGSLVVLNRNATIAIADSLGREREKYTLVYGARIVVKDGQQIEQGQKLVEWDPYATPILTEIGGKIALGDMVEGATFKEETDITTGLSHKVIIDYPATFRPRITIKDKEGKTAKLPNGSPARYLLPAGAILMVDKGDIVEPGDILAKIPRETIKTKDITGGLPRVAELFEARRPKESAIVSEIDGIVEFRGSQKGSRVIVIRGADETKEYHIPKGKHVTVHDGDWVKAGEPLVDGSINPHSILDILGPTELQRYLVDEIQKVYRLQGVSIHDKHIEVIVRQMMKKVRIEDPGDTSFLMGEEVDRFTFMEENEKVKAQGKEPAKGKALLLGITKASLSTESWVSAASFQETTRVLTDAAIEGKIDELRGLKENVIMGRIIPAGTGCPTYKDTLIKGEFYTMQIEHKEEEIES